MIGGVDFRRESARILAHLVADFGPEHLSAAEDAVQDAFVSALRRWPTHGVPDRPGAWLGQAARHALLGHLRHARRWEPEQDAPLPPTTPQDDGLSDDEVRMLVLCCHPDLSPESQIALTLRNVAGLSVPEIARALFASEEAVQRRITRAKQTVAKVDFTVSRRDLPDRIPIVLRVLYLLFNEGYSAHQGAELIRADLCDEAILILDRLLRHPAADTPPTRALMALMLLHSSRLAARVDADGGLCLMADQDRTKWDHVRIAAGLTWLARASEGRTLSPYHVEAAIAATHAVAPSYAQTDWLLLLHHYDDLLRIQPSGIVRLNRAVVVAMVHGPAVALSELDDLDADPKLHGYYLLPAVRGDLLRRLGRDAEATDAYDRALQLVSTDAERRFLLRQRAH